MCPSANPHGGPADLCSSLSPLIQSGDLGCIGSATVQRAGMIMSTVLPERTKGGPRDSPQIQTRLQLVNQDTRSAMSPAQFTSGSRPEQPPRAEANSRLGFAAGATGSS